MWRLVWEKEMNFEAYLICLQEECNCSSTPDFQMLIMKSELSMRDSLLVYMQKGVLWLFLLQFCVEELSIL